MSTPVQATAKPKKSFLEWCKSMRGQQIICTVVFLVLPLLLLFMFTYLPFFKMVEFSFFKMKYIGRRTFVGLQNYIDVFTRKDCFQALKLSLYYMVGSVVQMALALLFATILSFKVKGGKFFRGALYFPCLICGISVSFIFKFFFTHGFVLDTLLSWVVCIIKLKKMTGVISGTVTFINICHLDAPSIIAASYCDCGTFCSAARKMTIAEPNCQTRSRVTDISASDGSPSQLIGSSPKTPIKLFSRPSMANSARHSTAMATELPRKDGM